MMFLLSKLLAFALQPLFLVMLLLLGGLLLWPWRPRLGRGLAWAALLALVASTWTPIPVALMHRLEAQYPAPPPDLDLRPYAGVVVLGTALSLPVAWVVVAGVVACTGLRLFAIRRGWALPLARPPE